MNIMRNVMYLSLCIMLCLFACASEDSANTGGANTNAVQNTNTPNKTVPAAQQGSAPKQNQKGDAPRSNFNAGQANRLGMQYGKRYCKCINEGKTKQVCSESIVKGMANMKKALDSRIYKSLEKAYNGSKSVCE